MNGRGLEPSPSSEVFPLGSCVGAAWGCFSCCRVSHLGLHQSPLTPRYPSQSWLGVGSLISIRVLAASQPLAFLMPKSGSVLRDPCRPRQVSFPSFQNIPDHVHSPSLQPVWHFNTGPASVWSQHRAQPLLPGSRKGYCSPRHSVGSGLRLPPLMTGKTWAGPRGPCGYEVWEGAADHAWLHCRTTWTP